MLQSSLQPVPQTRANVKGVPTRPMSSSNYPSGRPKSSNKRTVAELERPGSAQAVPFQQQMQPEPIPLKYVVQEAVKRWFEDTLLEAQRGDVKQQALLGEMYKEGYGCQKDVRAGKEWSEKAAARGYKMQGVYCEL
ncbi:hypothetical protein VOLCADRAFT_120924 [Volvox carteri f. nagariensis]|uniref:Uncharacterized protein n=1 Tax=Volvox carteri f. nagariensis TaxID=3068 RepID=D8TWV9_VOLCA|nr:uncharacterized protein VOLCADRAFT_120924 [Volvox carteri f. nagariensis]EFJ48117.1 hypothetical protein VOLCADRAFT_120924 [Volvox carteri f. nagariensis]|eukprot:XP_002950802.1 hypothetical protein VOLCADRAFT_120924 [Volvox carteri f. nagariensis]